MKNLEKLASLKLESLGAVKVENNNRYFNYKIKTIAGMIYLKIDICKGSKLNSLFGNFLDNPSEAKTILGHWKYNLHMDIKNDFLIGIENHIKNIEEKSPFSKSRSMLRKKWNENPEGKSWDEYLIAN